MAELKNKLKTLFTYCLDVLRDNEHLIGDKALKTIAYLLVLRMLENKFNDKTINIDNYNEYDFSEYEENVIEERKNKLLHFCRFNNIVKEKEENIPKIMKCVWNEILSVHPKTMNIFLKDRGFEIKNQSTFKKLINKINDFNFEEIENDILGEAYEEVISFTMTGKTLGQFFTPPKVKQIMVALIDPKLKKNGKCETIFDPAMGTGGFLITSLRHIIKRSKNKNINIDWEFVSNNIGGREAENDTYQLAVSNMLISSGHMFSSLELGDSIRKPITNKYDIVLANPPFGIKGLKYDELGISKDEYLPIKSNSAVPLFVQAIINILKIDGRCAVVLPDGKDLFSKNSEPVMIREYLMKTCDLQEIIYLPQNIFTHTSIKTCIFYFIKKKEGSEILEVNNNKKKITYKFNEEHQTETVNFYEYDQTTNDKKLLVKVDIDKIVEHKYSLNYQEYVENKKNTVEYSQEIVIKKLDEVCEIQNGTRIVKENNTEGMYPVYGSGRQTFTTDTYNRENFNILIGRFALSEECVRLVNHKLFLNDSGLTIKPLTDNILHKFIAYYFFLNQEIIYNCARGTAQKNIDMVEFKNLNIPIPESIEYQNDIVKYLDFIYEKCIKTTEKKINELKELNKYFIHNYTVDEFYNKIIIKKLGEVCEIDQGDGLTKNDMIDGIYNVIGGGKIIGTHNTKNRDGYEITLTRVGDININYISLPYFLTDNAFSLKSNNKNTLTKFIYYLLLNNNLLIEDLYNGTAQKVISKTNLKLVDIPIISLRKQKMIVEYCEKNDELIKKLEEDIERNKNIAKEYLTNILNNSETEDIDV
jgi:type I restriction-modification system DNA methylase subunit